MTSPEFLTLQAVVAGRYSLDREIGRGGMAVVYLARDVALDRLVAIKLLPPSLAERAELRGRFLREARTAAGLSHPHIVPIHAVEEHGNLVFFVMTFVDGETLGQRVRRNGPLPAREAMRVIQEVAWALGHAHARGVVHRDVKPDNILLERDSDRALVTDFGIAAVQGTDVTPGSGIHGTPQYMAPEHAAGAGADARSDLYSLGVTAFFAITGRLPFEARTVAGLLAKHAGEAPPDVRALAPHAPQPFVNVIRKALEKNPALRPESADAFAEVLRDARSSVPDIPAPIRAFLREAEGAGGEIGVSLAIGVGALGVYAAFFRNDMFGGAFYPVSLLMIGLAGARFAQVVGRVRDLVRQGYDHRHIRPAIENEARRRAEEDAASPEAKRAGVRETAWMTLVGAAKTAASVWIASADIPIFLNFIGVVGAVMIPALTLRRVWQVLRQGKARFWTRWLGKGLGRFLFKIGGLGLARASVPVAGELTEAVLAARLDDLYQHLPREVRERFPELPDVVTKLEADAQALRSAGETGADGRLGEAIAALENLRLDLLRLHAGLEPMGELTRDLDAARRIGSDIAAVIAANQQKEPADL